MATSTNPRSRPNPTPIPTVLCHYPIPTPYAAPMPTLPGPCPNPTPTGPCPNPTPTPSPTPPQTSYVCYEVVNEAAGSKGGDRFQSDITADYAKRVMDSATVFVWWIFDQRSPQDTKPVTSVTLTICREFLNPSDDDVEVQEGELRIRASYFANFKGDLKKDFTGKLYFCMARVWQWTGNGRATIGLLTGIADYVRMKADFPVEIWRGRGEGKKWDQGYEVTAYFLDYCRTVSGKFDFIAELNKKLRDGFNDHFFGDIMNNKKAVGALWREYKNAN